MFRTATPLLTLIAFAVITLVSPPLAAQAVDGLPPDCAALLGSHALSNHDQENLRQLLRTGGSEHREVIYDLLAQNAQPDSYGTYLQHRRAAAQESDAVRRWEWKQKAEQVFARISKKWPSSATLLFDDQGWPTGIKASLDLASHAQAVGWFFASFESTLSSFGLTGLELSFHPGKMFNFNPAELNARLQLSYTLLTEIAERGTLQHLDVTFRDLSLRDYAKEPKTSYIQQTQLLRRLAKSPRAVQNLRSLRLADKNLRFQVTGPGLFSAVAAFKNLERLTLDGFDFVGAEMDAIRNLKNLRSMRITGNTGWEPAKLERLLGQLPQLRELTVDHLNTAEGSAFPQLTGLRALNVHAIATAADRSLPDLIARNPELEDVRLRLGTINADYSTLFQNILGELSQLKNLKSLSLESFPSEPGNLRFPHLEHARLSWDQDYDHRMLKALKVLRHSPHLTTLDLGHHEICADAWIDVVATYPQLRELTVGLTSQTPDAILKKIALLPTLRRLNLSHATSAQLTARQRQILKSSGRIHVH